MADILIRGLDPKALKRLRDRARRNKRPLQSEARLALEHSAGASGEEIAAMFDAWNKRFAGRKFSRSADLIREDRNR